MRSIYAVSAIEGMEVGAYHFTQGFSRSKSQFTWGQSHAILTVDSMEVGTYHFTWGQSVQSQSLRAWKLGLTTSHGGPKSYVPIHLRSIYAISIVEGMEVGTYHFTHGPKPYVPNITWMPTWQRFLEVRLKMCWESRQANLKLDPNCWHSSWEFVRIK